MRVNTAKQKMLQGKPAYGFGLGLGSPRAVEALSRSGIDFLLIDNQHGSYGPESTLAALIACEGGSATPMARVARNDYTLIGRLLDEGAMGIVVPMVDTVDDARAAAAACRFSPVGKRSYGWGRPALYGADYPDWINDQIFLAVQIESIQAVENAEAILAVPGVDGCWVGPADLALSMGIDPREAANRDEHRRALERVVEACRNTGKIPGLAAGTPENAVRQAERGFQFLVGGGDINFLMAGTEAAIRTYGLSGS